jgi:Tfp pilus assembly protein PilE
MDVLRGILIIAVAIVGVLALFVRLLYYDVPERIRRRAQERRQRELATTSKKYSRAEYELERAHLRETVVQNLRFTPRAELPAQWQALDLSSALEKTHDAWMSDAVWNEKCVTWNKLSFYEAEQYAEPGTLAFTDHASKTPNVLYRVDIDTWALSNFDPGCPRDAILDQQREARRKRRIGILRDRTSRGLCGRYGEPLRWWHVRERHNRAAHYGCGQLPDTWLE